MISRFRLLALAFAAAAVAPGGVVAAAAEAKSNVVYDIDFEAQPINQHPGEHNSYGYEREDEHEHAPARAQSMLEKKHGHGGHGHLRSDLLQVESEVEADGGAYNRPNVDNPMLNTEDEERLLDALRAGEVKKRNDPEWQLAQKYDTPLSETVHLEKYSAHHADHPRERQHHAHGGHHMRKPDGVGEQELSFLESGTKIVYDTASVMIDFSMNPTNPMLNKRMSQFMYERWYLLIVCCCCCVQGEYNLMYRSLYFCSYKKVTVTF